MKTHISYGGRENWSQVFPHARSLSCKEDDKGSTSNDCNSSHFSVLHFLYLLTLDVPLNLQEDRENKADIFISLFFKINSGEELEINNIKKCERLTKMKCWNIPLVIFKQNLFHSCTNKNTNLWVHIGPFALF